MTNAILKAVVPPRVVCALCEPAGATYEEA